jgi:hypothetical protein
MRFKLWTGALLVCALLTANGATAGAAQKRVFKGSTAQDRGIRVAVTKRSIQIKRFKIRLSCRDGSILILDESGFLRTPVRRNGRFRDAQYGRTDEVLIRGRVSRGVVRGRLRVKDKLNSGVRCRSQWVAFTARPRGR